MVNIVRSTEDLTYTQLEKQYDGYAVCLVNCVYDDDAFVAGRVFAYGSSVPECLEILLPCIEIDRDAAPEQENDYGLVTCKSFITYDEQNPMAVDCPITEVSFYARTTEAEGFTHD